MIERGKGQYYKGVKYEYVWDHYERKRHSRSVLVALACLFAIAFNIGALMSPAYLLKVVTLFLLPTVSFHVDLWNVYVSSTCFKAVSLSTEAAENMYEQLSNRICLYLTNTVSGLSLSQAKMEVCQVSSATYKIVTDNLCSAFTSYETAALVVKGCLLLSLLCLLLGVALASAFAVAPSPHSPHTPDSIRAPSTLLMSPSAFFGTESARKFVLFLIGLPVFLDLAACFFYPIFVQPITPLLLFPPNTLLAEFNTWASSTGLYLGYASLVGACGMTFFVAVLAAKSLSQIFNMPPESQLEYFHAKYKRHPRPAEFASHPHYRFLVPEGDPEELTDKNYYDVQTTTLTPQRAQREIYNYLAR